MDCVEVYLQQINPAKDWLAHDVWKPGLGSRLSVDVSAAKSMMEAHSGPETPG